MLKWIFKIFLCFLPFFIQAQTANISGVVNYYSKVTFVNTLDYSITIQNPSNYIPGDICLIIQMKGVAVDSSNTASFGSIINYNSAGNFEIIYIQAICGNKIYLNKPLIKTYDVNSAVQLVKAGTYQNANVIGNLTCTPWNSNTETGGVVFLVVWNSLTLNSNITADGVGYKGGQLAANFTSSTSLFYGYYYNPLNGEGGGKGESYAYLSQAKNAGRGQIASGGGGGNYVNFGGGGGGNKGIGGTGNNGNQPSSTNVGGIGGYNNPTNYNKIFMGGGGGAGQQNDGVSSAGGNGGGIILIKTNTLITNGKKISCNGNDAASAANDGAGGGGGGGTIILDITNPSSTVSLTTEAYGGKGGDNTYGGSTNHGVGAGGGGGYIAISNSPSAYTGGNINGGMAGYATNSQSLTYNTHAGATNGNIGVNCSGSCGNIVIDTVSHNSIINAGADQSICLGDSAQLLATGGGTYSWSPTTGLSNPNIANPIAKPTSSTQYVLTVNTGTCILKDTIIISVASCNSAITCNNCNISIPINNGLVACYPFNGNANDESGHGNNGVVTGATLTSDRNGNANKAYYFNGTSDYILAPNSSSLQPTNTLSVCAWVKPDVNSNQWTPVLSKRYTPSSDPWNSYSIDGGAANNQKWLFNVSKGTAGSQSSAITTQSANYSNWTFLVGTYDGVSQKFYVNGVLDKTISSSGNIGYSTMGFYIGNNNELSQWFKGKIDDVRIYNRALSACEIFTLYNNCSNSLSTNTGNDTTICKGNSVQLNATNTGTVSYRWIPTLGLSDSTIFNPVATPKSTTKYKVIASNGTCSVYDSITISVTDLNANAGLDVFSCKKDFVQLNGSGNGSFTWSPIKFINNINIQNPIVNPDTNIVYFLTVTNGTCISRDTVNVFVTSVDADIFNNDTSICIGDTVTFKTYINGNSFQWKPVSFLNDTNSFTPFANPDTTTKYFLTVAKGACIKKDSVTITVIKNLVANAGNDQQICAGNSVQLNCTGPFGAIYSWLPNYALSSTTISNPIANPLVDTSYFLKMQLGNHCVGYDTIKIVVNPNPTVDAGSDKNICREPFISIGLSSTNADSFYWSPSLGLNVITTLQTQASPSHNTTYFIKAINKNTGCFAFDTVTISLIKPTASFNEDFQSGQVPLDIHFTNTSSNAKNYYWHFGDSSAISSQINPFHIFTKEGLYKVILVAENNGCRDTAEIILHATGELFIFIPNAITANTDGLNDEFVISYTKGALKKLRGTIWNRWGTKIYEFEMPGGKWWDGKMDGQYVETDTFIYIIEATDFNDKIQIFKGNVTLLK